MVNYYFQQLDLEMLIVDILFILAQEDIIGLQIQLQEALHLALISTEMTLYLTSQHTDLEPSEEVLDV
jgi:hypothetical protein